MPRYSITYVNKEDNSFAYVDSRTYPSVQNAVVRAILHLEHSPNLGGAAIIYQGVKVQKRVRTIQFWNHEPSHK